MTSDLIQNQLASQQASRGIFSLWQKPQDSTSLTDLLKMAYERLQKAENDLARKTQRIKELENILTVDELTGITNRRGFYSAFEAELDRTNRGQNKGGLFIMIDLDHFKTINDTFGHAAGDEALRTVASFLKDNVRPMDCAARLGGDEFIILMSNTTIEKAMARAQKIGQDLNNLSFDWRGNTVQIYGSLGLKEFKEGDTIQGIIDEADKGMYESKARRHKIA